MADNSHVPNLELDQILQTLASLPQTTIPPAPVPPQTQTYDPTQLLVSADGVPRPQYPTQLGPQYGLSQTQESRMSSRPAPTDRISNIQSRGSTPSIDPTSITEWKHGLRCVNKLATQNPNFVPAIQRLMKDQERNIKNWESGRQHIIDDQKIKRETERTYRAALSLPGLLDKTGPLRTPEREKEELDEYDQKVYRACQRLFKAQSEQMKDMGVPFFGLKPQLILPESTEATSGIPATNGSGTNGKISKKQLLELQRKMLNHLVEMYGE